MANLKLRQYAAGLGVRMWELANQLGISENTLSRRLRTELSKEELHRYKEAVKSISDARTS